MTFILATSNAHKAKEFAALLKPHGLMVVEGLEIEESAPSYQGNSAIKLEALRRRLRESGIPDGGPIHCADGRGEAVLFADDSGLEADALDGSPGVLSSRFHPELAQEDKNLFIIREAERTGKRAARFVCCISFCCGVDGEMIQTQGECRGTILAHESGAFFQSHGFGYDPIFVPDGFDGTFGALPEDVKNAVSHRARAVRGMLRLLESRASGEGI